MRLLLLLILVAGCRVTVEHKVDRGFRCRLSPTMAGYQVKCEAEPPKKCPR